MPNNINLVTKFQPLLDEVYKAASLTGDLEHSEVKFDGSNVVKVLKVNVPALGGYTRASGYTAGTVDADWEPFQLTQDRGTEFSIDSMDDEETMNMTFGKASSEFIRRSVVPQVDAYRFATMAGTSGISSATPAALTDGAAVIAAINTAMTKMDEDEVTPEGRLLYINPTDKGLISTLDTTKSKAVMDRFSKIISVPQSRFYSALTISDSGFAKANPQQAYTGDGTTKDFVVTAKPATLTSVTVDGVAKTLTTDYTYTASTGTISFGTAPANTKAVVASYGTGSNINFMIVEPSAVFAVAKHTKLRIFNPDENQSLDAYKMQYRLYHDMFAYPQKVAGIYLHKSTT